jgi:DNA modification methylase
VNVVDADFTLHVGDCMEVLLTLPSESVHCCVTSPPYWGLRDYGTGAWDGCDPDCDHVVYGGGPPESSTLDGAKNRGRSYVTANPCPKCGARRIDQQLGLEETPELYVARMVAVFREVRRVLRKDGTCWVNLGDSYAGSFHDGGARLGPGLKPKDLVGIPWRVAFALQQDGWYLRSDIIWAKPNPMPESVSDRPTKAHEYVFLLAKSPRYFFDQEAVREGFAADPENGGGWSQRYRDEQRKATDGGNDFGRTYNPTGSNVRSVWTFATQPYPDAHFATFPEELPRRCILAGTSESCGCGYGDEAPALARRRHLPLPPVPATVLDPFLGSGTTAHVARKHGRRSIGIELNPEYARLAAERTQQLSLLAVTP